MTLARSAAKTSSFAQALVDEGLAAPERVANALSARFAMPVVDLVDIGVSADAAQEIRSTSSSGWSRSPTPSKAAFFAWRLPTRRT